MAHVVDDTIGGANSDSYTNEAAADLYNEHLLYGQSWALLTSATKNLALSHATKLLDEWVAWHGEKADDIQRLQWPRYDVSGRDRFDFDSDIIPEEIKNATAELARLLNDTDLTKAPDTQGFSELKVSTLQIKVDKSDRDSVGVLPESVVVMVEPYGIVRKRGASGVVELERA